MKDVKREKERGKEGEKEKDKEKEREKKRMKWGVGVQKMGSIEEWERKYKRGEGEREGERKGKVGVELRRMGGRGKGKVPKNAVVVGELCELPTPIQRVLTFFFFFSFFIFQIRSNSFIFHDIDLYISIPES